MTSQSVLDFWFKEITPKQWWVKDVEFDGLIARRFGSIHRAAVQGELSEWRLSAQGRLAEVVVLDQFSRNIYRDQAAAFASDPMALVLAQEAISVKTDEVLTPTQRTFLYMPFMHSESLLIHDRALELFRDNGIEDNLNFEIKHRDIIARFGRYPHRNELLGRVSSEEELDFLRQPGSSF